MIPRAVLLPGANPIQVRMIFGRDGSTQINATVQMNHTPVHQAAFHQRSPIETLLKRCPELTRERCEGLQRATAYDAIDLTSAPREWPAPVRVEALALTLTLTLTRLGLVSRLTTCERAGRWRAVPTTARWWTTVGACGCGARSSACRAVLARRYRPLRYPSLPHVVRARCRFPTSSLILTRCEPCAQSGERRRRAGRTRVCPCVWTGLPCRSGIRGRRRRRRRRRRR